MIKTRETTAGEMGHVGKRKLQGEKWGDSKKKMQTARSQKRSPNLLRGKQ